MAIAIVTAFIAPPSRATVADETINGIANQANSDTDFASILLGLPVGMANPVPVERTTDKSETESGETSLTTGELELMATRQAPSLTAFVAPSPTTEQSIGTPGGEIPKTSTAAGSTLAAGLISPAPDQIRTLPPPTAATAGVKPANLAVAEPPPTLLEQTPTNEVELPLPTSQLNPLPATPTNIAHDAGLSREAAHQLQTPLREPAWAGELGHKLLWFASNGKQVAQMTLNPAQLGTLEITLHLDQDGVKAHFVSANVEVRSAIEMAAPRLREMFAGSGIQMGQVSVGSESLGQQAQGQRDPSAAPRWMTDNAILGTDPAGGLSGQPVSMQNGRAMIDVFA